MAHKKSAGVSKNGRDSNPKYLGVKLTPGSAAKKGSILVRQRGSDVMAGRGVSMGKDHTLFAIVDGIVAISYKRKANFDNTTSKKKVMSVLKA
ncbi:50S ribosomal protein L27 [Candidatus Parcubacteria bacterium]|nr:50S ribosomal protein L27 [Candidatus Parcubacteria bacterium]